MTGSIPAVVKPVMLRWARESIGLSLADAAHKLDVDEQQLAAWETDTTGVTVARLRKMADLYRRPLAAFYLPTPPRDSSLVADFRRLPGAPPTPSVELMVELRRAAARREIALELADELEERSTDFVLRARDGEAAAAAAARVRTELFISIEQQLAWRDEHAALRAWRRAIEARGALVFQIAGVEVEETRGFSAYYPRFPIIALNSRDAAAGRCFTLMHELGHLVRRRGAVCDLRESSGVEAWCNRFAAELLVPADALRVAIRHMDHRDRWPDAALNRLARHFSVSAEVVLRRLVTTRRASAEFYEEWRLRRTPPRPSGGGPVAVSKRVISSAGLSFVGLVLSAFHADRITASTLSSYLGMRMKHLPELETLVTAEAG